MDVTVLRSQPYWKSNDRSETGHLSDLHHTSSEQTRWDIGPSSGHRLSAVRSCSSGSSGVPRDLIVNSSSDVLAVLFFLSSSTQTYRLSCVLCPIHSWFKLFQSVVANSNLPSHQTSRRTDSDGAGKLQLQGEGRVGGVKLAVTGGQLQNLHVEVIVLMDFFPPPD